MSGRGTAVADYDDDGDLDLLITTVAAPPRLLRNDSDNRHTGCKFSSLVAPTPTPSAPA